MAKGMTAHVVFEGGGAVAGAGAAAALTWERAAIDSVAGPPWGSMFALHGWPRRIADIFDGTLLITYVLQLLSMQSSVRTDVDCFQVDDTSLPAED